MSIVLALWAGVGVGILVSGLCNAASKGNK